MAGIETAAGVYGLITGTITILDTSIQIYEAVRDKSGITKELRKVSAQLPSIKELLKDAAAQYNTNQLHEQKWVEAGTDVTNCKEACKELQGILERAYPKADAGTVGRVFKNLGNIVSRRGKTAEELLKEIHGYLELLSQRRIVTNTTLLDDIRNAIDELFPKSGITQHNLYGTNVGGNQTQTFNNTGSGHQITGQGSTLNFYKDIPDELNEDLWIRKLLDWLLFPQIDDRESEVKEAHKATFRWALQPRENVSSRSPSPNLAQWLQTGEGVFWIQGKLGSGKSTLMKYVWQSSLLKEHLHCWADGKPLHCASFFFWKKGVSDLQRSLQGLYRTLLLHFISDQKQLARLAFPKWSVRDMDYEPTASSLRSALLRILQSFTYSCKCCIFIDGLDEYEEKDPKLQDELARDILRLSDFPGVKLVVASRPESAFVNRLDGCPTLHLQDLTRDDIYSYIMAELGLKMAASPREYDDPGRLLPLAIRVASRADGVFLWVVLVVADLVIDIGHRESYPNLVKRLDAMHDDLNSFFKQSLTERIMPDHRQEMARHLLIASTDILDHQGTLAVHAVGQQVEPDTDSMHPNPYDINWVLDKSKDIAQALPLRSRGLCTIERSRVVLVHSAMHDFLSSDEIHGLLLQRAGQFDVHLAIVLGMIAQCVVAGHAGKRPKDPFSPDKISHYIERKKCRSSLMHRRFYQCLEILPLIGWQDWRNFGPGSMISPLTFTLSIGCTCYLRFQIDTNRCLPRDSERPLLFYAVPEGHRYRIAASCEEQYTELSTASGLSRIGPLEMLLQHGADPNEFYDGRTPWSLILELVQSECGYAMARNKPPRHGLWVLVLASIMLRYGADPDFTAGKYTTHSRLTTSTFFADSLASPCGGDSTIAECGCYNCAELRPRLLILVSLVNQKKLEKRLGRLVYLDKFGIYSASIRPAMEFVSTILSAGFLEVLHSSKERQTRSKVLEALFIGTLSIVVSLFIWINSEASWRAGTLIKPEGSVRSIPSRRVVVGRKP